MSILQPTTKQNFIIQGVKFFKGNLDKLRCDSLVTDHPITTSEISVYMILHLLADEMGQIRSLTRDPEVSERKQLCISNLSKDHDLTYETVKKAFDSLLARNYIAEVYTAEGMHYEIVDYAKYNQQTSNPDDRERLNYFRIPLILFEERIFGQLIKQRFHKGPLLLLELCQYFTRQVGTNRRTVDNAEKIQGERTMIYLKKALGTTSKRVRDFLSIIHNVFIFTPIDSTIKNPSATRLTRVRCFVQVCIKKFSFSLNPACFVENDQASERRVYAAAKKEMAARMKHAKLPVKWRDTLDINKSIRRIVKISTNLEIINKTRDVIAYTVTKVADTLETMKNNQTLQNIKSIGAFVNKLFTSNLDEYLSKYVTPGERIEIITDYMNTYGEAPPFIKSKIN